MRNMHICRNSEAYPGYSGKFEKSNVHMDIENIQITGSLHLALDYMMMFILSGMKGC